MIMKRVTHKEVAMRYVGKASKMSYNEFKEKTYEVSETS